MESVHGIVVSLFSSKLDCFLFVLKLWVKCLNQVFKICITILIHFGRVCIFLYCCFFCIKVCLLFVCLNWCKCIDGRHALRCKTNSGGNSNNEV